MRHYNKQESFTSNNKHQNTASSIIQAKLVALLQRPVVEKILFKSGEFCAYRRRLLDRLFIQQHFHDMQLFGRNGFVFGLGRAMNQEHNFSTLLVAVALHPCC